MDNEQDNYVLNKNSKRKKLSREARKVPFKQVQTVYCETDTGTNSRELRLKQKIFHEVFPTIAQGFFQQMQIPKNSNKEKILQEIYDNTLVFLFRLLFLSYAEDRNLFPLNDKVYQKYSLAKIREDAARYIDEELELSNTVSLFWDRLKILFKVINQGDKALKIPPYNGDLFNPEKHPFLEKYYVADKFLVPAIDKLGRDASNGEKLGINYQDLSVRQLGSIYEGLLEFKLEIATQPLGIQVRKGTEFYVPVTQKEKIVIPEGTLFLIHKNSERKATGSYYTPDYIVKYIVENSLNPVVTEKIEEFNVLKEELRNISDKQELRKLLQQQNISFDPKRYDKEGNILGEKSINAYKNALLQSKDPAVNLLKINILDPAMGSGHFLVGAVDFLADKILEVLDETSEKTYFGNETYKSPLLEKITDIRNRILQKAQNENYFIDTEKLEDKNLIKRIILKRCIYGTDINPLAVELAKVSLWLHTFTAGAPLSFLDHHLKCGNSLVGASIKEFQNKIKDELPGSQFASFINVVSLIEELQNISDIDLAQLEHSADLYKNISRQIASFKQLLDVFTADFFLKPSSKKEQKKVLAPMSLIDGTRGNPLDVIQGKISLTEKEQETLEKALNFADKKKFFHWELEFPEVYYENGKPKAQPGFDVVIGNPPYIDSERMTKRLPEERKFLAKRLETARGNWDVYIAFLEKGINLLKYKGILSFITPDKWLAKPFGDSFRKKFLPNFLRLTRAGREVFQEAKVDAVISFFQKGKELPNLQIEDLEKDSSRNFPKTSITAPYNWDWLFSKHTEILIKLKDSQETLSKLGKFENACATSDAYKLKPLIQDKCSFPTEKFFKIVNTGTLGRYFPKWKFKKMKYLGNSYRCPVVERKVFKETFNKIYLQRTQNPKIILKGLNLSEGFLDKEGIFVPGKTTLVFLASHNNLQVLLFVLALINSKLSSFYLKENFPAYSYNQGINFTPEMLNYFPLPRINFSQSFPEELRKLKERYQVKQFSEIRKSLQELPCDSSLLYNFLAFLAEEMITLHKNKYLLELFCKENLEKGSYERIEVLKVLEKHPCREDNASVARQKALAENYAFHYAKLIAETDFLIDTAIYQLYGLNVEDIAVIEEYFCSS